MKFINTLQPVINLFFILVVHDHVYRLYVQSYMIMFTEYITEYTGTIMKLLYPISVWHTNWIRVL
jgi:hypothetical protein